MSDIISNMVKIKQYMRTNPNQLDVLCDLVKKEIDCVDIEMAELRRLGEKLRKNNCSHDMIQQNRQLICDYSDIKQQLYDFYDRIYKDE